MMMTRKEKEQAFEEILETPLALESLREYIFRIIDGDVEAAESIQAQFERFVIRNREQVEPQGPSYLEEAAS